MGLLPEVALTAEQRKGNRKRIKRELVAARQRKIFDEFWAQKSGSEVISEASL